MVYHFGKKVMETCKTWGCQREKVKISALNKSSKLKRGREIKKIENVHREEKSDVEKRIL